MSPSCSGRLLTRSANRSLRALAPNCAISSCRLGSGGGASGSGNGREKSSKTRSSQGNVRAVGRSARPACRGGTLHGTFDFDSARPTPGGVSSSGNATRALAGADLEGGALKVFRPSDVGESAPVTSRHVAEIAGHHVAHRGAVGQRRRLASIPTTDRQQQRPHGLASRRRDDKGPELVRAAIDNQRAVADSLGQRECRSALEPLGRAPDARRQDLFSHLGPRGDRVRSHPKPKSCERQALALRDDGLKTALLACTVERRDAVHSCKPKACRARPELGPRRPLAQLPAAGHGHHSQEHQDRESQKTPDELPHRLTRRNAACPTRSVCPVARWTPQARNRRAVSSRRTPSLTEPAICSATA